MDFKAKMEALVEIVNHELEQLLVERNSPEKSIYNAMKYSLLAGGKRLRPVLALAVCEMFERDIKEVMPYACAVEMIHTYSLIHDDLPAMDNDDYRRGRLTNHKVFGEGMAILAGDALLNYAFETMLSASLANPQNITAGARAMAIIANASGASGMIGGQVVDLEAEGREISLELLEYMHRCKTGALIKAPVMAAATICNASEDELKCLEQYAEKIGLAFQIKDDILDVEGHFEVMGKSIGSDFANKKSTFITVYGLDKSKKMLSDITKSALSSLDQFGERGWFLRDLTQYLAKRKK